MSFKDNIDKTRLPKHIAIIMDGNGRWAKERGKDRSFGHRQGVESVRTVTRAAGSLGIDYLTLYTFSTENWSRPEEEVNALMTLMVMAKPSAGRILPVMANALVVHCGRLLMIRPTASAPKYRARNIGQTASNTGITLVLALSYSSRWELVRAARFLAAEVAEKHLLPEDINEDSISSVLTTADIPDPDLLIRTGGEYRISNFLLWQAAYAELYFTSQYWPDFDEESLYRAICDYQSRERRFGKISEQL